MAGRGAAGGEPSKPEQDSVQRIDTNPVTRALAAAAIMVSLWAPGCFAQAGGALTIDPAMTKGPTTAPVTIVEFSDYQ